MALAYKDRTFCKSDCTVKECFRYFGKVQQEGARAWWGHDHDNAPVAMSDFSSTCEAYTKGETQ